mgnify:CR=1 FL=1
MFQPYDMHTHTVFSPDSQTPMEDMAEAAIRRGIAGMAITDHYNPDYPTLRFRTGQPTAEYHRGHGASGGAVRRTLEVLKGIELGVLDGDTMNAAGQRRGIMTMILSSPPFTPTGSGPLTTWHGTRPSKTEEVFRQYYEYVLSCIRQFKDYDVLAHLNLVDRYAPYVPDDSLYTDVVDEILRTAVADGKGLEINTASWRYRMESVPPPPPLSSSAIGSWAASILP